MIRATAILAMAWGITRLLHRRPAGERHLVWALCLGAAAMMPVLTSLVPQWQPEMAGRLAAALPAIAQNSAVRRAQQAGDSFVHAVGIEPEEGGGAILAVVWLAGTVLTLALWIPGILAVRRLAAAATPVENQEWLRISARLRSNLGIRRRIQWMRSSESSVPVTWGVLRPRILLPCGADTWTEDLRFSVLAHETAHIRRCDWLVQVAGEIVCAVYWFNPLFWLARNQLSVEAERACDDAVLNQGVDRATYAQHLLDIARSMHREAPAGAVTMARRVHLETRVLAILNPAVNRSPTPARTFSAILLTALLSAGTLAAVRLPATPMSSIPTVIRYTQPPLYSDEARRLGIEGTVLVEATVDQVGRAAAVRVIRGLGHGLDENALLAVRGWRFAAGIAMKDTRGIPVLLDVEFSLRNAELNEMIANDMVTSVGPDVTPPRIVRRVAARYSGSAGSGGSVMLDVVIQTDGTPRVLRVLRSLSWGTDEAAIAALEQWRFSPAELGGEPVKVRMNIEIPIVPLAN